MSLTWLLDHNTGGAYNCSSSAAGFTSRTQHNGNGRSRAKAFEKQKSSAHHSRPCAETRNPLGVHAVSVRGDTFLQELLLVCRAQLRLLRANHSWRETPGEQEAADQFCERWFARWDGAGEGVTQPRRMSLHHTRAWYKHRSRAREPCHQPLVEIKAFKLVCTPVATLQGNKINAGEWGCRSHRHYSQGFVEEIFVELFHAGLLHFSLSTGSVGAPLPLLVPPLKILACVRLVQVDSPENKNQLLQRLTNDRWG